MTKTLMLIKIELLNLFGNNNFARKKSGKKAISVFTFIAPAGVMLYISVLYSFLLMDSLPVGSQYIMPVLMTILSFIVLLSLSFYNATGHLFGFKDFDLLMSLPISKISVMVSKLVAFLLMDYFFALFLVMPYIIVYGIKMAQPFLYYLFGIIAFVFLPLIPMAIASILALVINSVTGNFRYKALLRNILTLLMVGIIMFGSMQMQNLLLMDMTSAAALMNNIKIYAIPIYYFIQALINLDVWSLILFILISTVVFVLFLLLFTKMFTKVNIKLNKGYKVKNFHLKSEGSSTRLVAMFKLQVKRYFGSTVYLVNTIVGPLMLIVFIIIGALSGVDEIKLYLSAFDQNGMLMPLLTVAILFISSMCVITACSISLEGKNIDMLKSFPIPISEIFIAKILVQVIMNGLICILTIILGFLIYDISLSNALILIIVSIIGSVLYAVFGLVINLLFPKMNWDSETIPVKQSMSVIVAMFGGMIFTGLQAYGYILLTNSLSFIAYLSLMMLFDILLITGMWSYLTTFGARKFKRL